MVHGSVRDRLIAALFIWLAWTALAVFFGVSASLTYISQGRAPVWALAIEMSLAQWWPWRCSRHWWSGSLGVSLAPGACLTVLDPPRVRGGHRLVKVLTENAARRERSVSVMPAHQQRRAPDAHLLGARRFTMVLDRYGQSRAWPPSGSPAEPGAGQLLRAQLQPHFLFNTLNAVPSWCTRHRKRPIAWWTAQ